MSVRTNEDAVKGILNDDYGPKRDGTLPDLTPYIASASAVVTRVAACAVDRGVTLSSAEKELIERWLAAHLYTKSDPTYSSRSTAGASGSFVRNSECPEPYKDGALSVDPSGCLNALLNNRRASIFWVGKTEDEAIPVDERTG